MGITNAGITMVGRWEEGLLDLEVVEGIGIRIMCQHLEVMGSFGEGVGACTTLKVAVASVGSFVSITPTIGTMGGEGDMEVVASGWRVMSEVREVLPGVE